jgi:zinc transport system substrate-binding protein
MRALLFLLLFYLPADAPPLRVFVSILPQAYFVERIGGDAVRVEVLVGPGKSHHTYELTPKQAASLAEADVFFRIGAPFETGLATKIAFTMEKLKVVETQEGVPLQHMAESGGQGNPDPHIWLAPELVKTQAETICRALCELRPEWSEAFRRNLASFQSDLDRLNQEIGQLLRPCTGREVYVFHPAFGYFLSAYGLVQVPIEVEGKEPGPRQLAQVIDRMRNSQAQVLFVQPQFSTKTSEAISAAIGARVVRIDPLARDYLENLRSIAAEVSSALACAPAH